MNAVRPATLAATLILAALAGCMVLVTAWSELISLATLLPNEIAEGATSEQSCVDDVSITVDAVWEGFTYTLADPPDYSDGDAIWIAYTVTNDSCGDVTVSVALTGSVSKATIHDADGSTAPCADECTIPAESAEYGTVQWDLSKHANATGEKVVATMTIDAPSDFSDTDTSNNSATSSAAINIVNEVSTADIGVKSVTASRTTALIGDDVDFIVTIRNDGDAEADATVTLDHGEDTDELDSTSVSALSPDAESTVTLSWDTDDATSGEHILRVLTVAEGDGNSDNDSKTVTVTLRKPSTDAAVTAVQASSTEVVIGDTVDFTVSLKNDGDVVIAPTVSLYKGEDTEALGSAAAATIAAGGTYTVIISWDTDGAEAGSYNLRAVATVAGDDDSSNDSATASITLRDPVDVALSLTSPIASSVIRGDPADVHFTVTNNSENDAQDVLISLYVTATNDPTETADAEEPAATLPLSTLAGDASSSNTLTWDTTNADIADYNILLLATTDGDTDQTNNAVSATVEIRNWLALQSVSPQSSVVIVGAVAEFTAQVKNVGQEKLSDLTVGVFEPNGIEALASSTISSIAAGNTATATIEWNTDGRDVEALDLIVAAGADGQDPDRDDSQFVSLDLRNPIALSSAVPASADNVAGSSVAINIQVLNESDAEVTDVTVDLFIGDAEEAGDSTTIESIAAGETVTTSLTWDAADAAPGERQLKVVASLPGHDGDANDTASLAVTLVAPALDVALMAATINRKVAAIGQTLDAVATISNHSEVPVAVPVSLYLVGRLQQTTVTATATSSLIEPGSSKSVTVQWDSTGESVGTHTLKIVAELPGDTTADNNVEFVDIELFPSAFDGAAGVDECVEDVRVNVSNIRGLSGQARSPPDYQVGEQLKASYRVYNFSCDTDVTLSLAMTGPEGHLISDAAALCFANCVVPFGGKAEDEIAWTIPTLPALGDQPIEAKATIVIPSDFVDANEANNSNSSTDRINIVHPNDVVLRLGEQTDNKVSTRQSLAETDFGEADVRLVSVQPVQTTVPFAAETIEVVVAAANDGPATEPASLKFSLASQDGTVPPALLQHKMVISSGQTKTETLEVPLRQVLPGVHTIEVLLSAAVDQSRENNSATFEFIRSGPMIEVEMLEVSVAPEVLILGDEATVSLAVHNKSEIALPLTVDLYVGDGAEPAVTKILDELASGGQSQAQINWRVPASAQMLGQHTLRLASSSPDFGVVAVINPEITIHIDAEIVNIGTTPADTAMQGEEVVVEVEVQNNGPATVNVPVTLRFPSETKNPETRRPPVPAGSTETTRFSWKTRDYAVGDHILTLTVPEKHNIAAGATSTDVPFQLTPLTITSAIVDVAVAPQTPSVGEPVSITVTVRNDGPITANIPVTLHFPSADKRPVTRRPRVDAGQIGTATFEWLTSNYRAGIHQFGVELAAVGDPFQRFTVDLLPAIEDASIVAMATYPAETAMVGEPVEVWIDVRNDGPVALNVPVRLTFPSAGKRPEVRSPRVGPGETATVFFEWKTSNYEPGIHTLRATILLDSNITVGQPSEELQFVLTPLVIFATVLDVSVSPETPRVGEPVTIILTLRNDGWIPVNIPATLYFPSDEKQPETRRPRVEPGAVGSVAFTWRTSRYEPGAHEFRLDVPSDPPISQQFTVELLPPIVDVAIAGMGSVPSEMAVQGQEVNVWVDVINKGPLALNVPVQLAFPSNDKLPERKSPRVEPGEIERVEFTWKTANYASGDHLLTATLLADYNIAELDTSATIQIALVPAQLKAAIVDLSWRPESPVVGEPVRITVTVRNGGIVAANIPVILYFPSGDKQPETRRPRVAPGAVGTADFTWRTSHYDPGDYMLRAQIPGVPGALKEFEIELRPPAVDFAVVTLLAPDPLYPIVKGDWVQITAVVQNLGPYAGRGTVALRNEGDRHIMYEQSASLEPGEFRDVEFTWKTLRYPVGGYELLARVDAEHDTDPDNDESARERVHLLTDRDITVGFGSDHVPLVFAEPASGAALSLVPQYRNDILIFGNSQRPIDRPVAPASDPPLGVSPKPTGRSAASARMYWWWRSVQRSPWECARFQLETGKIHPRPVLCPKAPALVR